MIWGFGTAGYGPFRTRRILDSADAGTNLLKVAQIATETGGLDAYRHVAKIRATNNNYLKFLGPAFGTKFIYFAQKASNPDSATPIMDAVIRRWFAAYTPDTRLILHKWDLDSYKTYVELLASWAENLALGSRLSLDQVEYLIFAGPNRNWSIPADPEPELSVVELVDRLKAYAESDESINAEATKLLDEVERLLAPNTDTSAIA